MLSVESLTHEITRVHTGWGCGELKGKTGSADGLYPKEFGVNANSQMTCTLWKEHTNYSIEDTRALKVRPGRKGKLSELFKSSFNLN